MTSNVGSSHILEHENGDKVEQLVGEALQRTFRPEFLNRIDASLVFNRLSKEAIRGIADIQLDRIAALLNNRALDIEVTAAAKDRLAAMGYDPAFGARPLRRVIQQHVLEPLSEKIIAGDIAEGECAVVDVSEGNQFKIQVR
jgi:ATP-dependent Clp protease ATP-binding subunit ClpB